MEIPRINARQEQSNPGHRLCHHPRASGQCHIGDRLNPNYQLILVGNKLFATLDPTTRRLALPDKGTVLLSDTVGFIHKLPPTIVSAFRATLEELAEAHLLVHVVDITSPNLRSSGG